MKTLYEVLGVKKDASISDVKSAYRKAVLQCHPDVSSDISANERFIEVEKAYSILSNQAKRKAYDFTIRPQPTLSAPAPRRQTPTQQPVTWGFPTMRRMRQQRADGVQIHARVGWSVAMCPLCGGREVVRSFKDGKFVVDPCPRCDNRPRP